jgi:hypothetical protein
MDVPEGGRSRIVIYMYPERTENGIEGAHSSMQCYYSVQYGVQVMDLGLW